MSRRLLAHGLLLLPVLALGLVWPPPALSQDETGPDAGTAAVATGEEEATPVEPWPLEPFASTPAELREAAAGVPVDEEHGVQVLLEEGRYVLDEAGRITYRFRLVYRIDDAGAIDGWSGVSRTWSPWFQDRPEIRVRVVTASGEELFLDPETLGSYGSDSDGPEVYGDQRALKGPLPGVGVGTIVEEEHVVRDREPMFSAGVVRTFRLGRGVPIRTGRMIVDAPVDLPLTTRAYRLPGAEPREVREGGRRRLTFELHGVKPWEIDDELAPGDVARSPAVAFATGRSWQAVAAAYGAVVDDKLSGQGLRSLVRKASSQAGSPEAVMAALLAAVQERVRYTAIEFGEGSIVPREPSVTLDRRFGDCKDKATLLVALLREAGIEAHVALLRTGPSFDVDPDLPGMGAFDHAIVHVAPDTWIDPTSRYARVGQPPTQDQGRLALIAAAETTGLVRIPRASPADNIRREVRRVELALEGPARILETTEVTGYFDRDYRETFADLGEKDRRERLESYVKGQYRAEELGAISLSDMDDLSEPVVLEVEALDCGRAYTGVTEAEVALGIASLVTSMPDLLDPSDEGHPPREHGVELPAPHEVELVYRIIPPPGHELAAMPDDETVAYGPATMSQSYVAEEDGSVTARLHWTTGTSFFTLEQVAEVREQLAEFYDSQMPVVSFHNIGEKHLQAGRLRQAMAAFRELVDAYPDEALYHTQVARAFLAVGLGGEARREARRAVELDPGLLRAQTTLGFILSHDLLGRKFEAGFDHAGAEEAWRAALELDPDSIYAQSELAILLEFAPDGERYGSAARLDEAIAAHRRLREDLENESLTNNLALLLLRTERDEELRELWRNAPRNQFRDGLYLAAVAVLEGAPEAVAEASRITDGAGDYRERLSLASDQLLLVSRYEEAADLLAAAARGDSEAIARLGRVQTLRKLVAGAAAHIDTGTPEGVAQALLVAMLVDSDPAALRDLFEAGLLDGVDQDRLAAVTGDSEYLADIILGEYGVSRSQLADWIVSLASFSVEGSPEVGYRVTIRYMFPGVGTVPPIFVGMAPGKTGPRVIGFTGLIGTIGRHILKLVDDERLAAARQWLDWMAEETFGDGEPADPLEAHPLQFLWSQGSEASPARMRLAAASLLGDGLYGARALKTLRKESEAVDGQDDLRIRTGKSLARMDLAFMLEEQEVVLEAALKLEAMHPRSGFAFNNRVLALMALDRYDEADAAMSERRRRFPGDSFLSSLWSQLPMQTGDLSEARQRLQSLIDSGRATSGEYNNLAWLDVVQERVSDDSVLLAQQAVDMEGYSEAASLHTLATIYAEKGMVSEARDVLIAMLDGRLTRQLESSDWYVLGRIAEHYEAYDAAHNAYAQVKPREDGGSDATSTSRLARRRLERMAELEKAKSETP